MKYDFDKEIENYGKIRVAMKPFSGILFGLILIAFGLMAMIQGDDVKFRAMGAGAFVIGIVLILLNGNYYIKYRKYRKDKKF